MYSGTEEEEEEEEEERQSSVQLCFDPKAIFLQIPHGKSTLLTNQRCFAGPLSSFSGQQQ